MATVNELVTALGFKLKPDTMSNLEKMDKGLEKIASVTKKMAGFFLGFKGAVDYFTGTVMRDSQELVNLSKTTGYSIESLQKWKYAAEASGVSAQSFIGDMESLRKTLLYTEGDIYNLADQLASMDKRTAMQWASKIGISDETLIVMRKGSSEIKRLMSEAYVIPEENLKKTAEFNAKLSGVKQNLKSMKNEIFMAVSPALVDMITKFQKWLEQNKEFIRFKLERIIEGITKGFERFGSIMTTAIGKLADFFGLINEDGPDVEEVANAVTKALLVMVSAQVISGLVTVATNLGKILGFLKAIALYGGVQAATGAASAGVAGAAGAAGAGASGAGAGAVAGAATGAAGPGKVALSAAGKLSLFAVAIDAIISSGFTALDFAINGTTETIKKLREDLPSWYNIGGWAALAGGWLGDKFADALFYMQNGYSIDRLTGASSGITNQSLFEVPQQIQNPGSTMTMPTGTSNITNTTNDSHNTMNMYVTTLQQAEDPIKKFMGLQPTTPGGFAPVISQ